VKVPVFNATNKPNLLCGLGIKIPPYSWAEIPLEEAVRFKKADGLVFDWSNVEGLDYENGNRHLSFWSPFNPNEGYGLMGCLAATSLDKRGIAIHVNNNNKQYRQAAFARFPELAEIFDRPQPLTKWGICHAIPTEMNGLRSVKKISWTMWECTRLPSEWVDALRDAAGVIVPTYGQIPIFRDSGVDVPIYVVPDGVEMDCFPYVKRPEREIFTFITWGRLSARKCPLELAECFRKAFPKEQDVRLIFKTREATLGGPKGLLTQFQDKRITAIDAEWPVEKLTEFVRDADCAVFASHGEGFGQPAVQAMASGLPVILSNHSGQSDFCNDKYNYPLRSSGTVPAINMGKDLEWWENDYSELVELMRHVYTHRKEAAKKGKLASEWVRKKFSVDVMADKLAALVKGLD
jgi:glycosyltransferase involved in cell wall biosynthesis